MNSDNSSRPLLLWIIAGGLLLAFAVLGGVPPGVVLLGALGGLVTAASSVALILIYRTHGFLNLAQPSMALLTGVTVARVAESRFGFWGALLTGCVVGAAAGLFSHFVLWRFRSRPALTLVAASVGIAYLFGAARAGILFSGGLPKPITPFELSIDVFPVLFKSQHVLAAALAVLGVAFGKWFYSRSLHGVAARAVGSNFERSACLGIPARRVSALTWLTAGLLAAAAGAMTFTLSGPALDTGPGASLILFALLPAVAARMAGVLSATAVSMFTGVAHQCVLWVTDRAAVADVALFLLALLVLALDREASAALRVRSKALADVARIRGRPLAMAALTVAALSLATFVLVSVGSSTSQRIGSVGVFALAGAAVSIAAVFTGTLSLGHWAVVGAGSFAAAAAVPLGYPAAAAAGVVAGAAASVVAALPAQSKGPFPYAVATIGFAVAAQGLFTLTSVLRRTDVGLGPEWPLLGRSAGNSLLICFALAGSLWLARWMRASRLGLEMLAVRDSERVATAYGLNAGFARVCAYVLSGAVAGVAGFLYLFNQLDLHPAALGADRSILLTAMVVVGGAGSVWGGAMGAAAVSGATLFLNGPWELLGTGGGILLLLLLLPGGFASASAVSRMFSREGGDLAPLGRKDFGGVLEVSDLQVSYPGGADVVRASLTLDAGEVVSLTGANGSGKSTFLKAIAGLVPSRGSIRAGQMDLGTLYPDEVSRAGVVLVDGDNPVFEELTVRENLRVASFNSHPDLIQFRKMLQVCIGSFPRTTPMLDRKAGSLSGGEQRFVALCQTMFQRPRVLMLDELDAGLDSTLDEVSRELERSFASRGTAVIRVAHSSNEGSHREFEIKDGAVRERSREVQLR
ncbi:MAG TPA: ATP-binding cassette domain-containing protein [Actinomycetota bacterium]|nr:ATP-binding cassette domain-containing protein [Actinomycetota bacterium]